MLQDAAELTVASICLDRESRIRLEESIRPLRFMFLGNSERYVMAERDMHLVRGTQDSNPRVIVLDFDHNRNEAALTAERIRKTLGSEVFIFAASSRSEPEFIISAMRCGCSEYLVKPLSSDKLREAFAGVEAKLRIANGLREKAGC